MTEKQKTDTTNFTWGTNSKFADSYSKAGSQFDSTNLKHIPRLIWDNLVGAASGVLNTPADIASLFNNKSSKNFAEWWENNLNTARDSLQSNELLTQRKLANDLLNKGESLGKVVTQYPEAALAYLMELGVPTKAAIKAGSKAIQYSNKGHEIAKQIVGTVPSRGYGLRLFGQTTGGLLGASIYGSPLSLPAIALHKDFQELNEE